MAKSNRQRRLAIAAGAYTVYQPGCKRVYRPCNTDDPDGEPDLNVGQKIAWMIADGMSEADAVEMAKMNHIERVKKYSKNTHGE